MKKFTYIILMTLISICSIFMTGCGESYKNLTLHFSDESIELNLDEEKSYTITVDNVGEDIPKFNFGFDKKIATLVGEPLNLGNGKFKITIKGLMASSTTLTITLLQNNKSIDIPVKVYENLERFSLKDNKPIYILRGESYTFSDALFNFYPDTNQTDLIFSVNSEVLTNGVLTTNIDTPTIIKVNAKSVYKENLSVDIDVYVLDKIDNQALKDVKLILDDQTLNPISKNEAGEEIGDVIEIIANDKNEYVKNLKLVYDTKYDYQFLSKEGNISVEPSEDSTFENVKFINVQYKSKDLKDNLIIRISHKNFDDYYVDLNYKVEIKLIPKNLQLNGEEKELRLQLFDNSNIDESVEILASVEPLKSTYEQVKFIFYGVKEVEEPNGSLKPVEKELNYNDIKNYLCILYNKQELSDNVINDLSVPIKIYGRTVLGGMYDYIKIRVVCESILLEEPIYNDMYVSIFKAATRFYIDDNIYKDSTIYVKNGTEVDFSDFVILEEDAYIGKIIAVPEYLSAGYVEVKQIEENSKTIHIKALKAGQATYTLYLSSGISTKIKIVVKDEINIDNFMLYVSGNSQQGIAEVKYKKVGKTETLKDIAVRGANVEFAISYNVLPRNIDPDMYTFSLESTNTKQVLIDGNKTIKTLISSDIPTTIKVSLKYYVIENFKKVLKDVIDLDQTVYNYNFDIVCFEPIKSFSILGKNTGMLDSVDSGRVDVYEGTGFVDKALSHINLSLWVDGKQKSIDKVENLKWSFSVEYGDIQSDSYGKYYELSEFGGSVVLGRFYTERMEFICDGRENIGSSLLITAQIEEHGKVWASTMQINIRKYEQVENIWLSNFQEKIYLDNIRNSVTLYPYIVPSNATNKNFIVQFIPDVNTSSTILSIVYDSNYISLKYNGRVGGSGTIKIIPNSKFTNENEYSYSLDLRVEIGDGTQENPLRINTIEEFKNIDVSKYYIIQSMLDAKGEVLEPFAELTGGIKGENGGIKNFVISKPFIEINEAKESINYFGLFPKISGILEDLTLIGSLNILDIKSKVVANYVGLVCGLNKGTIKNVNVTYLEGTDIDLSDKNNCNVSLFADKTNYVGLVCGKNIGTVLVDAKEKVKSTLMVYMPDEEVFKLNLKQATKTLPYYLGGVTGYNEGNVAFEYNGVFSKYNYYGTNVVVNMHVYTDNNLKNTAILSNVGGVVGYNKGSIKNIQAYGNVNRNLDNLFLANIGSSDPKSDITSYYKASNVGGIVGFNENGEVVNNTARVFVSGKTNVGGLIGYYNAGTVLNNKVQAVDDAKRIGLNASMIVCYTDGGYNSIANNLISVDPSNISESYYYRIFIDTVTTLVDVNSYYGDMVCINAKESYKGEKFARPENAEDKFLSNLYDKTGKYKNNTIVLSYYCAENESKQKYLNEKNTVNLPKDLFIDILEISIESNNPSIISVTHNGNLVIHSTGFVVLKLQSVLKADDTLDLNVYVTNYINGLEIYTNPSREGNSLSSLDVIELSNKDSYNLYPKYKSSVEVGNTIIELVENKEAKLTIYDLNDEKNTDLNNNTEKYQWLNIRQSGNVITFQGKGNGQPVDVLDFGYYVYIELPNSDLRYLINNDGNFEYTAFDSSKNLTSQGINTNFNMKLHYEQGIYAIDVDKSNLTVAPIDVIQLRVNYLTYSTNKIDLGFDIFYEDDEDYLSGPTEIAKYFNIQTVKNNNENYIDYIITMNINKVRLGDYRFIFYGANKSVYKSINVKYITQPINNIGLNNYTEIDNRNIIREQLPNGGKVYNTSYTMQETNTLTAGGTNLLRINIEPVFSSYEYIDITNDKFNIDNGKILMFSLLKQYYKENQNGFELVKDSAVVSSDSYYIPNGIRIYRDAITNGQFILLYSLSTNVIEGEQVKINLNFYNSNGESVYPTQQKTLEVAVDKSIRVRVVGRDKYLARGRRYVLDVKTLGYNDNEVYVTSNSPYAKIEKDTDGTYYLQISNKVSYGIGEGATFSISYYGERLVNGVKVRSSQGNVEYTIVEYVADSLNIIDMFKDDKIILNVNDKTDDIRDKIIDRVQLEYTNDAVNAVEQLKATLKTSATYFYKLSKGNEFEKLIGGKDVGNTSVTNNKYVEIDGYTVTPKFVGENTFYLGVYAELEYYSGYLRVVTLGNDFDYSLVEKKSFGVIANQRTSDDNEMPIRTYKEFTNISEGNSYILMNDIFIESDYVPLDVNFKSFDGNGYNFIFKGAYKNADITNYGLFAKIYENSIVKNVNILIEKNNTAIFNFENTSLTAALTFGLLASENYGVVYNCSVEMGNSNSSIEVVNMSSVLYTSISYVSALIGANYGYITNSRVSAKIECKGANLAGFVGVNNGNVSSSYVKKSMIKNMSTDVNNSTGGFCVSNNKKIFACFVEGNYNANINAMFADDFNYIIRASSIAGAFIYNNIGEIDSCYANIPIISSSRNSGFVGINEGTIKNSYTTSRLGDKDTANYPFFISNSNKNKEGMIQNCYFLSDKNFNVNVNTLNNGLDDNVLRATTMIEFATQHVVKNNKILPEKLFTTFIQNKNKDTSSGIWFFAKDPMFEEVFQVGKTITSKQYNEYILNVKFIPCEFYIYKGVTQKFVTNRLQLVSANMLAYSQREIIEEVYKEETNETIYKFSTDNLGTKLNPYIVTKAQQFEDIILDNAYAHVFEGYLRIIKDLDYQEEAIVVSKLFKVVMAGYIEGNGLTISGYSLNNNESLLSAGLFSQIGNGSYYAVLQNIIFAPKYINLPNAYNVGSVAGTVYKANIYNVFVDGYKNNSDGLVVMGRDIVGGVFGRTINDYDINTIKSSVSVNAYLTCNEQDWTSPSAQERILYSELKGNVSTVAYSGCIIGFLGGIGNINRISTEEDIAAIGMISGFIFGGLGLDAKASNVEYTPTYGENNFIRASAYGGIIVGDNRGTITNVVINKNEEIVDGKIFKNVPRIPQAIGAVAGIVRTGKIINAEVNLSIKSDQLTYVVGGIAGKVDQIATFENCVYRGDVIEGRQIVGGIIGEYYANITTFMRLNIKNCTIANSLGGKTALKVEKLASDVDTEKVYIGGVIGVITGFESGQKDGDVETRHKIAISGLILKAEMIIDMKMYGQPMDEHNNKEAVTNYFVSASNIIGGYVSEDAFEECLKFWNGDGNKDECKIIFDYQNQKRKTIVETEINLSCQNLIYGESINSDGLNVPKGYMIRISELSFGSNRKIETGKGKDEYQTCSVSYTMSLNGQSISFASDSMFISII